MGSGVLAGIDGVVVALTLHTVAVAAVQARSTVVEGACAPSEDEAAVHTDGLGVVEDTPDPRHDALQSRPDLLDERSGIVADRRRRCLQLQICTLGDEAHRVPREVEVPAVVVLDITEGPDRGDRARHVAVGTRACEQA